MKMSILNSTTKTIKVVTFFFLSFLCSDFIMAQVYVQGYYRTDGTYVKAHYRSSPDSNPYNNYSYPGNSNPYTGKIATGNSDTYLKNYNNTNSNSTKYSNNTYKSTPSYNTSIYSTGNTNTYSRKPSNRSTVNDYYNTPTAQQLILPQPTKQYYINSFDEVVERPTHYATPPRNASAVCRDGTYSFSRNRRGTCSHHGGVKNWL